MAKNIPLGNIDLMLAIVEGDELHVNSSQPTTFLEATATFQLATFTLVGAYTKANGDVSGRKNTLAAQLAALIDSTGTATHVSVTTTTGSVLELVTTTVSQLLTSGGTVDTSAFDHEIEQAT